MDILLLFWYFYIVYICVGCSNVNVVYIWFKYKDYMLYGRFKLYLTIRLRAGVFYEQIVIEAQPSWLSLVENSGS